MKRLNRPSEYARAPPELIQINDELTIFWEASRMTEAEVALKRWKLVYDELVRADRALGAMPSKVGGEAEALKARIATLTRESDAALAEVNRCVALVRAKRQSEA